MSKKHPIKAFNKVIQRRVRTVRRLAKGILVISAVVLISPYIAPDLAHLLCERLTAFAGQSPGLLNDIVARGSAANLLIFSLLILIVLTNLIPKGLRGKAPQVYMHSMMYHPVLRKAWLASVSVAAITAVIWIWPYANLGSATWLTEKLLIPSRRQPYFNTIVGLLISQAIVVNLLMFPVWFSPAFRSAAWVTARTLGSFLRWLRTDWRLPILLIGLMALALYGRVRLLQHYGRAGQEYHEVDFLLGEYSLKVMVATALLILIYWAYQARTRIIITAFEDSTQDPLLSDCAKSIHSQLLSELSRLYKLYNVIDDASPANIEQGEIINATVTVESLSQDLAKAVTPDSKLDMGFIKIPIGSIMGVIGRVVQGPRIIGSLHKEGDNPILIASLNGGGLKGSWRVDFNKLAECYSSDIIKSISTARKELKDSAQNEAIKQSLVKAIGRMTDQLACRIFTEIANPGSPRWLAVSEYTNGLRLYRDTLRTKQDRDLKLRQAEKSFISALSHDNKFAYNHYNLSIVYREMGRPLAARAALTLAIREAPTLCKAYYALALSEWDQALDETDLKRYEEVINLCDQMITLDPDEPLAWSLKSLAHRKIWKCNEIDKKPVVEPRESAIQSGEIATALAWRDLCLLALKGRKAEQLKEQKGIARSCTCNLAATYIYARSSKADPLFRQARRLSDADDAETFFEWGKAHKHTGNFVEAAKAFDIAARLSGQPIYWAHLACAKAHIFESSPDEEFHRASAEDACYLALGTSPEAEAEAEKKAVKKLIEEAWEIIFGEKAVKKSDQERPPKIIEFVESLQKKKDGERSRFYISRLRKLHKRWNDKGWKWGSLRTSLSLAKEYLSATPELAKVCLKSSDGSGEIFADDAKKQLVDQAKKWLEVIINVTEQDHNRFHVLRAQSLHTHMARACLQQRQPAEALYHAERAVTLNPERCWERSILGEVYWQLENYERAEVEYATALNLYPGAATLKKIAKVYWSQGDALRNREKRCAAFQRVIKTLTHALDLAESKPFDLSDSPRQLETCGWIHYWLGWFNYQLKQYDKAISHLRIVRAIAFKPLESRVILGLVYTQAGAFNEAEEAFRSFEEEVEKLPENQSHCKPAPLMGEEKNINELRANTYHYWAISLIKRGANLDKAEKMNSKAEEVILELNGRVEQECKGMNLLCKGWIMLEKADSDSLGAALNILEDSIDLWVDARAYYQLARGYFKWSEVSTMNKAVGVGAGGSMTALADSGAAGGTKLPTEDAKKTMAMWLEKSRDCCALARDNDLRGELDKEIDDLIKLIDAQELKLASAS